MFSRRANRVLPFLPEPKMKKIELSFFPELTEALSIIFFFEEHYKKNVLVSYSFNDFNHVMYFFCDRSIPVVLLHQRRQIRIVFLRCLFLTTTIHRRI